MGSNPSRGAVMIKAETTKWKPTLEYAKDNRSLRLSPGCLDFSLTVTSEEAGLDLTDRVTVHFGLTVDVGIDFRDGFHTTITLNGKGARTIVTGQQKPRQGISFAVSQREKTYTMTTKHTVAERGLFQVQIIGTLTLGEHSARLLETSRSHSASYSQSRLQSGWQA